MKLSKFTIRELILFLIALIFIFQNLFELERPVFLYFDETVSLLAIIYYFIKLLRDKRTDYEAFPIFILMNALIILGLASNYLNSIQHNFFIIMVDLFSNFKFLFLFLGLNDFLSNLKTIEVERIIIRLGIVVKIYTAVLFVFSFLNLFVDIGMYQEYRFGLRTFSFIFGTPGQVINLSIAILIILLLDRFCSNRKNTFYLTLVLFVILSTLKSRAFVITALFIILYQTFVLEKKVNPKMRFVTIIAFCGLVGFSRFKIYFLSSNTPRQTLFLNGIKVMRAYFPLGSGFATYGSDSAAKYYSKLYYQFGYHLRYGMNPSSHLFLNDTFWPMIFAQFGFFGLIIFILLMINYFKLLIKNLSKTVPTVRLAVFFYIFNVVLSSIQSSYPGTNSMVITTFFITFAIVISKRKQFEGGLNDY
ncbi:hypothetical protein ACTGYP_03755 [Streptococcus suis]